MVQNMLINGRADLNTGGYPWVMEEKLAVHDTPRTKVKIRQDLYFLKEDLLGFSLGFEEQS